MSSLFQGHIGIQMEAKGYLWKNRNLREIVQDHTDKSAEGMLGENGNFNTGCPFLRNVGI